MLFGLPTSGADTGTAPAGGLVECRSVDAGRCVDAACVVVKPVVVLGEADQAVEKSLQQVHGVVLRVVDGFGVRRDQYRARQAHQMSLTPVVAKKVSRTGFVVRSTIIRHGAFDEAHSRRC